MAGQHGDVFAPLTQGRQAQANHIQAVKQVLPKATFLDPLLQILVRGSNHPHIGSDCAMTADAVHMAVAQHTQQPGLQIKGHVADFIEKQGAAVGLLEAAPAHALRPRESAALMAKEFGLEQVLGNGSGVDGYKRPLGARRMFVQRTRYQLLARARLPRDHDRDIALAQAPDGAENILHGRRLAKHLGGFRESLLHHLFALAFLKRAADQFNRLGQIKRFWQVLKSPALKGRYRAVKV